MNRANRFHILTLAIYCVFASGAAEAGDAIPGSGRSVRVDSVQKTVRLSNDRVGVRIRFDRRCVLDSLWTGTRTIVGPGGTAYSGFRTGPDWHTTGEISAEPGVASASDSVTITGIRYPCGEATVEETWRFRFDGDDILWTIDRVLPRPLTLDDNAFPAIRIRDIDDVDGALLGNGGVAWFRLFNDSAIAYGVHTNLLTFWKTGEERCLRLGIRPDRASPAVALSRAGRSLTCSFTASPSDLRYRYDAGTHRRRFIRGSTDLWQPMRYPSGAYRQVLRISSPGFQEEMVRGTFPGIDGGAVTSMLNTIARLGVIDSRLYGGNSWHTPYGPVCLHEQYIGQFGIAIDDGNYVAGYRDCLDYYRDHAIGGDGRVKARWAYTDEDAMPGSADTLGFYEAQWGMLLDSNPDFVINVADLFDQSGDLAWLRSQKGTCERVLGFLLQRDSDRDSLVEMFTESHGEKRGSDWLDVIWASWENAFVNAELYHALTRWSELEEIMADSARARGYLAFAAGLKRSFNRTTADGGFWESAHGWYVHWRDKDGSIYGDNLVTSVNFMAIAYGLCDDPGRRRSILQGIEKQMQKENLFFWPSCMFPYEKGAGHDLNFPFPAYENGDIFLSWGELGVRSYAAEYPDIALRYVRNVVDRYTHDGLAYQRYLRTTQQGSGDDILSGNASAITGLYRDIYGVQPRHNRLYLNPHLTKELYGTLLRYHFQNAEYDIELGETRNAISAGGFRVSARGDFALKAEGPGVVWYAGNSANPAMALSRSGRFPVDVIVREWTENRHWSEKSPAGTAAVSHEIMGLPAHAQFALSENGQIFRTARSDGEGVLRFDSGVSTGEERQYEVHRSK
ncbi:MAG TPA: hypothetical protein VK569_04285 [Bacteroidota bacterium]|nr:hypothetical protein [Bacteroidota bacterium]